MQQLNLTGKNCEVKSQLEIAIYILVESDCRFKKGLAENYATVVMGDCFVASYVMNYGLVDR